MMFRRFRSDAAERRLLRFGQQERADVLNAGEQSEFQRKLAAVNEDDKANEVLGKIRGTLRKTIGQFKLTFGERMTMAFSDTWNTAGIVNDLELKKRGEETRATIDAAAQAKVQEEFDKQFATIKRAGSDAEKIVQMNGFELGRERKLLQNKVSICTGLIDRADARINVLEERRKAFLAVAEDLEQAAAGADKTGNPDVFDPALQTAMAEKAYFIKLRDEYAESLKAHTERAAAEPAIKKAGEKVATLRALITDCGPELLPELDDMIAEAVVDDRTMDGNQINDAEKERYGFLWLKKRKKGGDRLLKAIDDLRDAGKATQFQAEQLSKAVTQLKEGGPAVMAYLTNSIEERHQSAQELNPPDLDARIARLADVQVGQRVQIGATRWAVLQPKATKGPIMTYLVDASGAEAVIERAKDAVNNEYWMTIKSKDGQLKHVIIKAGATDDRDPTILYFQDEEFRAPAPVVAPPPPAAVPVPPIAA
jgi:hypothetical protein